MAGEKILDIDDSPTVQRLIHMILSSQGYEVVLASDGEEGIAMARSERPAVILVDFVMPKMNGFQVCKILKEDPDFKDTPIILVTSKGEKVGSKFVDTLGITEYFTKPFQPDELLAKIREVIDKRKEALRRPPPPPPRELLKEALPGAPPSQGGIEAMVRSIVEQMLEEFAATALPGLVQKALAAAKHEGAGAGIRGNLESVQIAEVMQALAHQRQTGTLAVTRAGESIEVYFHDGLVVFASADSRGGKTAVEGLLRKTCGLNEDSIRHAQRIAEMTAQPLDRIVVQEKFMDQKTFAECLRRHTESAVFKIMAWKQGAFSFEKAAPPVFAVPVRIKVDDLLLEGARRADEWGLIQQKIPDFTIIFEPMIGNAEELTTRGMSAVDLQVFSLINGKRTIQDIIEKLCLDEFDVAKSMFILLSVNLIRRKRV